MTTTTTAVPTYYRSAQIDGLNIAYREAGDPDGPKLVLLHGFPASSDQYRNLIPALATRFHVIAPDYPGFGNSDMPDPATFPCTFDRLSEIVEPRRRFSNTTPSRPSTSWAPRIPIASAPAEIHRLKAGHFAVEDSLNEVAEGMHRFYLERVAGRKR
jgi:alpha-beta hydrolase superfamily lysophospholipase